MADKMDKYFPELRRVLKGMLDCAEEAERSFEQIAPEAWINPKSVRELAIRQVGDHCNVLKILNIFLEALTTLSIAAKVPFPSSADAALPRLRVFRPGSDEGEHPDQKHH